MPNTERVRLPKVPPETPQIVTIQEWATAGFPNLLGRSLRSTPVLTQVERQGIDGALWLTISEESPDRTADVVRANGWDLQNYLQNPVILFCHDYHSLPIGRTEHLHSDPTRLRASPSFPPRDLYPFGALCGEMLGKFLNAASVGFRPVEWSFDEERMGFNFERQELLEWSLCPVPMHPLCLVEARSDGLDLQPLADWADQALQEDHFDTLSWSRPQVERLVKALGPQRHLSIPRLAAGWPTMAAQVVAPGTPPTSPQLPAPPAPLVRRQRTTQFETAYQTLLQWQAELHTQHEATATTTAALLTDTHAARQAVRTLQVEVTALQQIGTDIIALDVEGRYAASPDPDALALQQMSLQDLVTQSAVILEALTTLATSQQLLWLRARALREAQTEGELTQAQCDAQAGRVHTSGLDALAVPMETLRALPAVTHQEDVPPTDTDEAFLSFPDDPLPATPSEDEDYDVEAVAALIAAEVQAGIAAALGRVN